MASAASIGRTSDRPSILLTNLPQYDMTGWLGGGTVGVNAQAGRFVFGVEGEMLGTDIKGSQTIALAAPGVTQTLNYDSKIDWLALATARAGFVVGDRLMFYGKGGLAIAQEKHNFNFTTVAVPPSGQYRGECIREGRAYRRGGWRRRRIRAGQ